MAGVELADAHFSASEFGLATVRQGTPGCPQNRLLDRVGDHNTGEFFDSPLICCECPAVRTQVPRNRDEWGNGALCR